MPSTSSFVTKTATHFCYKCGWIDDVECTMERKVYTDKAGKEDVSYYHIKTDKNMTCPECNKRTALPMTMGNAVHAIEYLMRSLR